MRCKSLKKGGKEQKKREGKKIDGQRAHGPKASRQTGRKKGLERDNGSEKEGE